MPCFKSTFLMLSLPSGLSSLTISAAVIGEFSGKMRRVNEIGAPVVQPGLSAAADNQSTEITTDSTDDTDMEDEELSVIQTIEICASREEFCRRQNITQWPLELCGLRSDDKFRVF